MAFRGLIPWSRAQVPAANRDTAEPFLAFHREMNRLFDELWRGFDVGPARGLGTWPSVEVVERDKEIVVTAEIPGLAEKDVEATLENDVLILRGEKKSETTDANRHFSERTYGRFERIIPLDVEIDHEKVQASYKNGVLTIRLPKSANAVSKVKRIPLATA